MADELQDFFERYAERAIREMKASILAQGFYQRALNRLEGGDDLSGEIPLIGQLPHQTTVDVVQDAIKEYKARVLLAWEMPKAMASLGKFKISHSHDRLEHLPRVEVLMTFPTSKARIKVTVTTAGENYKIDIDSGKNQISGELARNELSKKLVFLGLQG